MNVHELKTLDDVIGAMACYYRPDKRFIAYYVCFYDSDGKDGTTGWMHNDEIGAGASFGLLDYPPIRLGEPTLPSDIPEPPSEEAVMEEVLKKDALIKQARKKQ
jgi:hypothetical protein